MKMAAYHTPTSVVTTRRADAARALRRAGLAAELPHRGLSAERLELPVRTQHGRNVSRLPGIYSRVEVTGVAGHLAK